MALSEPNGRVVYLISGRHTFAGCVDVAVAGDLADSITDIRLDGTQEDGILAICEVTGLHGSAARQATAPLVELIQDWLVLEYPEVRPIKPELVENTVPEAPGADAVSAVIWGLYGTAEPVEPDRPHRLDQVDLEPLEALLQRASPEDIAILSAYRISREERSNVAEFVLLYSVCLWITRDPVSGKESQAHVDRKIWELDPTEERLPGARFEQEGTRYTKLRNDIGHPRRNDKVAMKKLRADVDNAIGPFRQLVRRVLRDRWEDLRDT